MRNTSSVPNTRRALALVTLPILALGASMYASLLGQAKRFTVLEHAFRPEGLAAILLPGACFLLLAAIWIGLARSETRLLRLPLAATLQEGFLTFTPLAFLYAALFTPGRYFSREDLLRRLTTLGLMVFAAFVFLKLRQYRRDAGGRWPGVERALVRWEGWPRRKKITALFLAAFVVYNLAVFVLVAQGITFSGDEPNYLITADSLLDDHDINLANNYAEQDYFHFISKKDNPNLRLGIYGRYGKKGHDYIYPINLPGISVLTLPFYALGRLAEGRLLTFLIKGSLAVWGALFGVQIYLFALDRWRKERLALALWALVGFTAPVLFYSTHLYPEIAIAFMALLIYRKATGDAPLRLGHYLGLGFLASTFFWFGVKYNLIFWPLLAVALYHFLKRRRAGWKVAAFLAFPLLSNVLFYVFTNSLYGTASPLSIYEGVMTPDQAAAYKQMIFEIPLHDRVTAFFDYFLDQRDGLWLYAPFYIFALFGYVEMFRRAKGEFFGLLAIGAPFVLNYAFFTHRQGFSPQGRVLMPLVWTGAIAVGYFLAHTEKRTFRTAFWIVAAAGVAITVILLTHPTFLYQPTTHEYTDRPGDLWVWLSNVNVFLPPLLPSFIKVDNTRYAPDYVWVLAIAAFVLLYALGRRTAPRRSGWTFAVVFALLAAGTFLWVLEPGTALYPAVATEPPGGRAISYVTMPLGRDALIKPDGGLYLHAARTYRVIFSARRPVERLTVRYGAETGEYEVRIRFFDLPVVEERTAGGTKELDFAPPTFYPWRNFAVYEFTVELRHLSDENMRREPFSVAFVPR